MKKLIEKYGKHACSFMGTFTFTIFEITDEIMEDFKNWKYDTYQDQIIFHQEEI